MSLFIPTRFFGAQSPVSTGLRQAVDLESSYPTLSSLYARPPDDLETLMGHLIGEWKQQAGEALARFGYQADW